MKPSLGQTEPSRAIGGLSVVAVVGIACVTMALFLRHGLPAGTELEERMAFIAAYPIAWPLAWLPWMASALGLLLFCFWLRDYAPAGTARSFGITLVAIGVAPDIAAELMYAVVLPELIQRDAVEAFRTFELLATLLTGALANGAYCLGGLVLNLALFGNRRFPRRVAAAGLPAWIAGLGLSAAVFGGWMGTAVVLTGVSMTLSLVWMFVITVYVFRFPDRYRWQRA